MSCWSTGIFEPESKASTTHFKASLEGFYGLILEKLVTEKFSDSSLAFPSTSSISTMAQDGEDMVPLDPELLAVLEEEAASRYTEEDNQFTEHCKKSLPKPPILPADRFDRNRQCRGNFRHQDYRKEGGCRDQGEYRGHGNYRDRGNYRDHRREYSDYRQGRFVSDHRDHDDSRRDSEKRKYRSEKESDEYGRRNYQSSKYYNGWGGGSSC
ncbi:uncharacterized protein LOC135098836 [Scylla paramamosain]|uniref:uncharacterized protein LOC135098836 n=1 Tax=Scylla paramamosain TaxID=85552 RepID=UPI003082A742